MKLTTKEAIEYARLTAKLAAPEPKKKAAPAKATAKPATAKKPRRAPAKKPA